MGKTFSTYFLGVGTVITNIVILNLLWVITSLPIVTLLPSTFAVYSVVHQWREKGESSVLVPYFKAWITYFKRSYLIGIPVLAAGGVLYLEWAHFLFVRTVPGYLLLGLVISVSVIYFGSVNYLLPLAIIYDWPVWKTIRTSVYLGIHHSVKILLLILPIWLVGTLIGMIIPITFVVFLGSVTFWVAFTLTHKDIIDLYPEF